MDGLALPQRSAEMVAHDDYVFEHMTVLSSVRMTAAPDKAIAGAVDMTLALIFTGQANLSRVAVETIPTPVFGTVATRLDGPPAGLHRADRRMSELASPPRSLIVQTTVAVAP